MWESFADWFVYGVLGLDPSHWGAVLHFFLYETLKIGFLLLVITHLISREALGILKKIGPYVLAGIGVGAFIHGFVPTGFFEQYISESNPLAVPLSVVLAVPMYASASGVIPVVQALVAKGIPLGTAMAFMMGVVGLSLPEAMMLKKVMRVRLLGTFFSAVALSIILLGYTFNVIF